MSVIKTQQTDSCVMSFISLETSKMSHLHLQTLCLKITLQELKEAEGYLIAFIGTAHIDSTFHILVYFAIANLYFQTNPLGPSKKRKKGFGFFPHFGGGEGRAKSTLL